MGFVDESGDALDWFPSLVAEKNGALCFGLDALARIRDEAWTVARSFKRVLADAAATPDHRVRIGDSEHSLQSVLVGYLDALRIAVLERSNLPAKVLASSRKDAAIDAVVATPANALGPQRFLTLDAFRKAGFRVNAMLNEPSAAGFEYSHRYRNTLTSRREHVVVYDLGGGTFDASLVRMTSRAHDVVVTGGKPDLGGDDFDEAFARLVAERAAIDFDALTRRKKARLLDACRDAKERLSPSSRKVTIDLEGVAGKTGAGTVTLDAKDLYAACAPLVNATLEAMIPVMNRLDEEAGDESPEADGEPTDAAFGRIAGIYVVGGASSFPAVGRALRDRFGRRVHASAYPSASTAVGLAIAADGDVGFELTDRFSRYLGVFREGEGGRAITFDPIFAKDASMPSSGAAPHVLARTYRPMHNVGHYRFVECSNVDANGAPEGRIAPAVDVYFPFDHALRERGELDRIPVQRLHGPGPTIREEYRLDAHGLVELTMTDVETGYAKSFRLSAPLTSP